jgi:hypothetical protein
VKGFVVPDAWHTREVEVLVVTPFLDFLEAFLDFDVLAPSFLFLQNKNVIRSLCITNECEQRNWSSKSNYMSFSLPRLSWK